MDRQDKLGILFFIMFILILLGVCSLLKNMNTMAVIALDVDEEENYEYSIKEICHDEICLKYRVKCLHNEMISIESLEDNFNFINEIMQDPMKDKLCD